MSASNVIITHTLNDESLTEAPNRQIQTTRGMIRERAVELAVINGRKPHETSKSDWEDAKREMVATHDDAFCRLTVCERENPPPFSG